MLIFMLNVWNVKGKGLSSFHVVINTAGQKVLIIFPSKHEFVLFLDKTVCVFYFIFV